MCIRDRCTDFRADAFARGRSGACRSLVVHGDPARLMLMTHHQPTISGVYKMEQHDSRITVSGIGRVIAPAPSINLVVEVVMDEKSARSAQSAVAQRVDAIVGALEGLSIAAADIVTVDHRVHPRFEGSHQTSPFVGRNPDRKIKAFTARHVLHVRIADTTVVGSAIDAVLAAGATGVDVQYERRVADDVWREARDAAMHDAFAKARQLAELAEATLEGVLRIDEGISNWSSPYPQVDLSTSTNPTIKYRAAAPALMPFQASDLEVTLSLNVVFCLGSGLSRGSAT